MLQWQKKISFHWILNMTAQSLLVKHEFEIMLSTHFLLYYG